ncbi:hypothetical protein D3C87_1907090 [compost metagenome]
MLKGDIGVLHQWFHGVDGFQARIEVDRVVDAKNRFADVVAASGGTAFHLFIKNSRAYSAHKHEVANFRHVNAGGEQIYSDSDARMRFVFVLAN